MAQRRMHLVAYLKTGPTALHVGGRRHPESTQARSRAPHECAILPAVSVVIGETPSTARERAAYLDSLVDPERSLAASSSNLGADLTKLGSDATLATLQGNQGMQGSQDLLNQVMRAEGVSFRQAAVERAEARELVGTPSMIADRLQETELQRRGLFRTEYSGRTLRENLQA